MKSTSALSFIVITVALLSGCTTIQQRLAPPCECEVDIAQACQDADQEVAHAVADHQVDQAHYRAQTEEYQAARKLDPSDAEEETEELQGSEQFAEEPVDPTVAQALVSFEDEEEQSAFEAQHQIEVPDGATVYRGHFESQEHSTVAIHRPGEALELYREGSQVAALPLEQYDDVSVTDDEFSHPVGAVDLMRDGRAQLKLTHVQTDDDGDVTYYIGMYKLIGENIGTIFRKPIATGGEDGSFHPLADVRYLHGTDQRIIEWIALDEEGQPTGEPAQYHWNHWEGVYRVPKPPPTAPSDPQS